MPRRPRVVVPGQPLHIIQRGVNREPIFFASDDYWRYLHDLKLAMALNNCDVHAYVLMTNHVHIIATGHHAKSVAGMMQSLGRRYVRFINLVYERTGTLWEGRFKSGLIDSEDYLLACYRYVELNPLRAGMVDHPARYPWSSYHHNARGKYNDLVSPHDVYQSLAKTDTQRLSRYSALFEQDIDSATLEKIRIGTQRDSFIGNDSFKDKIEKRLGRKLMIERHGGNRRK
jgi:putative transposase